jgi:hypothetical protein
MASNNFQAKSGVKVYIAEGTVNATTYQLGDTHVAGDSWIEYPITDYSIPFASAPVEISAQRAGKFIATDNQQVARTDNLTWSFDVTLRGTPDVIEMALGSLIDDGASPCVLAGNYEPPEWKDQTDYTGSMTPLTILFKGAATDDTDVVAKACIATNVEFGEDSGSEGGNLTVKVTFFTAYQPVEATIAASPTLDTGIPKNIRDLESVEINSEPLFATKWNIALSRSIERLPYKNTNTYDPFGYVQTGTLEVGGSLSVKRDDGVNGLLANFTNGTPIGLEISESSGFSVGADLIVLDQSAIDSGGSYLVQDLPFKVLADASSESTAVITVTIS